MPPHAPLSPQERVGVPDKPALQEPATTVDPALDAGQDASCSTVAGHLIWVHVLTIAPKTPSALQERVGAPEKPGIHCPATDSSEFVCAQTAFPSVVPLQMFRVHTAVREPHSPESRHERLAGPE